MLRVVRVKTVMDEYLKPTHGRCSAVLAELKKDTQHGAPIKDTVPSSIPRSQFSL